MLLMIVIPVLGLAIDAGVVFMIKAKLQASVDGAALASARGLSEALDLTSQQMRQPTAPSGGTTLIFRITGWA